MGEMPRVLVALTALWVTVLATTGQGPGWEKGWPPYVNSVPSTITKLISQVNKKNSGRPKELHQSSCFGTQRATRLLNLLCTPEPPRLGLGGEVSILLALAQCFETILSPPDSPAQSSKE